MANFGEIHIVGGGLAGSEAAWQALRYGYRVSLHEMRPDTSTPAHRTDRLAELVCSNSLKSTARGSAPGQLKREMRRFDSLIMKAADQAKVGAGQALAVDRDVFSESVTTALTSHPNFTLIREEVKRLPKPSEIEDMADAWIVATGPLTTKALSDHLGAFVPEKRLFFYDAIAPIIAADSIDYDHAFFANRYDKDGADYLNLPLSKSEYESLVAGISSAQMMPLHNFEDTGYFEACLPIEVMVERGIETLRFGPLKPVGLKDPRTGGRPWAVVQLRKENTTGTMFSMVGFQTKMKWPEQKRVFSSIPALRNAEFFRFGSVHRNTYFNSPRVLNPDLSFRQSPRIFLAGQLTGVEGYTESTAIGILAAHAAMAKIARKPFRIPPSSSVMGALAAYVTEGGLGEFQPMNANFGLLPPLDRRRGESKSEKKLRQCIAAEEGIDRYLTMKSGDCPAGQVSSDPPQHL